MFVDEIKKTLNSEFNSTMTENAALAYRTTGKALLDISFKIASLRRAEEDDIIDLFMKAFYEDKTLAMKWLFYVRDAREGLGERRLFRIIIKHLCMHNPDDVKNLIRHIPEYGRFDDLLCIIGTQHTDIVTDIIKTQLKEDETNMANNKPISLLAKWLPSPNTSSEKTVAKARELIKLLGITEASYRKTLSKLRKYADVVEIKMSGKRWSEIKYETVPSRANLIYRNAFLRNDEVRRRKYLAALEKGVTTINASVLYPHDIVHGYTGKDNVLKNKDTALEELWKALPDTVNENANTIVVADGSGSMTDTVANTNVSALSVANAIAIYFAERGTGQFKNKYITFSKRPQLVDFSNCESLREKIELALRYNEIENTDIKAVFKLILKTAVNAKMAQSDMPRNVLIISDMEFDDATEYDTDKKLFEVIAEKYEKYGYKLPRLVFWNVNSRTGAVPVIGNDLGVALVSGFSVNIMNMVLSGEIDPYKCLISQLMSERYAVIEV